MQPKSQLVPLILAIQFLVVVLSSPAADLPVLATEAQPLGANIKRVLQSFRLLGTALHEDDEQKILAAIASQDAREMQRQLDPQAVFLVSINPEARVKVAPGNGSKRLQQSGFTPLLVKIINESTATKRLKIVSPQSGPVYAGTAKLSMTRQQQTELLVDQNVHASRDRFLNVEMYQSPPLTANLSGLEVEYAIALIYCSESGRREATIGFDIGEGNQDLGFRGETPILFDVRPAVSAKLRIRDHDGTPTTARLLIRDRNGHVHPPVAKRLAPDLFFQPQIYRRDGETIVLPPGEFQIEYSRGPEYRRLNRNVRITAHPDQIIELKLDRWVDPANFGFFSGDHHIHAAGCAHYTSPTEGVRPEDMFLQVQGEGLNVGCVLTWGPCFRYQRQFFEPRPHDLSERHTLLKYDLEISGFGSQSLGHVCLLNLRNQEYPGSDGTETKGWPTWTTPVMRWAKEQGGYTGYAHSASGLAIDPPAASRRLIEKFDRDGNQELVADELRDALLPEPIAQIDLDRDGRVTLFELTQSHERAAEELPNFAIPEMNGVGAMEICVSTAEGVCDFISAMDTRRIQEWNTWYHLLNCGFPLSVSGETDFPCMSSTRVGQGRVYVQLGKVDQLDYSQWCAGLAQGRSYVSDGYAHALDFKVNGTPPGNRDVALTAPADVEIRAQVCFSPETPRTVAQGLDLPPAGRHLLGDTVELHASRHDEWVSGGERRVELIVNGRVVAHEQIAADGRIHDLSFKVPVEKSSWMALRQFPQLHTNPVRVIVGEKPIRASRDSARWCLEMTELLWKNRARNIIPAERDQAQQAFQRTLDKIRAIYSEAGAS